MRVSLGLNNTIGWFLVLTVLALVGFWVPREEEQIGASYLIFYFHFPSAVNCLNFFIFAGVLGLVYLLRRGNDFRPDHWAAAAVEVGMLACTITLVTGSIWAKAAWNIWWDFTDPRLMTVAIMWFTYAGYMAFRSAIDDPFKRGRFSAVFALVAAVNVPLVLFSIRLLGSVKHQMNVSMDEFSMVFTRWFGVLAFFVLYVAIWRQRYRVYRSRHGLASLEERFHRAGI